MTIETVRVWLAGNAPDLVVIDQGRSTATVAEAAEALGVEPGRIAKTLALRVAGQVVLLVARGDARLDNAKCKAAFGARPRLLPPDETLELTGHPVGGVCPFGLATPLPVYLDQTLRAYDEVYPAAGSLTSSVRVTPGRLFDLVGSGWVDACRLTCRPTWTRAATGPVESIAPPREPRAFSASASTTALSKEVPSLDAGHRPVPIGSEELDRSAPVPAKPGAARSARSLRVW